MMNINIGCQTHLMSSHFTINWTVSSSWFWSYCSE